MKQAEGRGRAGRRAVSRPATDALVMREVRRFMATTAEELVQLLDSARALRRKLERSAEYRRASALSRAGRENECNAVPAYDLAGTLEVLLEEDLENMVTYLRAGARTTRRARRTARGHSRRKSAGPPSPA